MKSLDRRGGSNRYKFQINFFKRWSNKMAYVLGFLYADGCIVDAVSSRTQYIQFTSKDKEILEKIKRTMQSEHSIYIRPPHLSRHRNGSYMSAEIFTLRIGSKKMFNDLIRLGLTPHKSKNILFPTVPLPCLNHFIRGYFDGDGCIYLRKAKGITKPTIIKGLLVIFTSGSSAFLKKLGIILKNQLGLCYERLYNGNRAFQLKYNRDDSIKMFKFLYKSCSKKLYLKRKFDIFRDYFKLSPQRIDTEISTILKNLSK